MKPVAFNYQRFTQLQQQYDLQIVRCANLQRKLDEVERQKDALYEQLVRETALLKMARKELKKLKRKSK